MLAQIVADNFSGGQVHREAGSHFSPRQWATLKGVVLEGETDLRSQWAWQRVGGAGQLFTELGIVDDLLVAKRSDGTWHTATEPSRTAAAATTRTTTWTALTGVSMSAGRPIAVVPLRNETAQGFVAGLLLNDHAHTGDAYIVYKHPGTGAPTVKTLPLRYPNATTDVAVPRASTGVMWGDFLVLGDTHWLADDTLAYGSGNTKRYPHALWFAQPGNPLGYDLLDVEFMGVRDKSETLVRALLPTDMGMLVLTSAGTYLLRGTADDHTYEELRVGLGARSAQTAVWWPHLGVAAWVDLAGQLWTTNGKDFARLDEPLGLARTTSTNDSLVQFGEYLLLSRDDRMFCFKAFQETGAWSELIPPTGGTTRLVPAGDCVYALDVNGDVWRLNRGQASERGHIDGAAIQSTVASRTFVGEETDAHRTVFWHRFGVRVDAGAGAPTLDSVTVRPGPATDAALPTITTALATAVASREALVVPGHGPSVEASVEFKFTGDVKVEQVAAWHHAGRDDRG